MGLFSSSRNENAAELVEAEARVRGAMARGDKDGVRASGLSAAWDKSTQEERDAFAEYLHGDEYPKG